MKVILFLFVGIFAACSSAPLKYEKAAQLAKNDEFERAVKIERPPDPEEEAAAAAAGEKTSEEVTSAPVPTPTPVPEKPGKGKKKAAVKKAEPKKAPVKVSAKKSEPSGPTRRQPELEDDSGFSGRRPLKDPFRVGEEVVHDVHYFKVSAGEMKLKVNPMATVDGRKSYNFTVGLKTSSVFSSFYSVDDKVETFVDYETLVPRVFTLHVKESGQLREARMLFDEKNNQATFWEKKVTKDKGEEEKKLHWEILPYSQNVYSAAFYMRNFQWDVGKEYAFRVADDEQNLVFKGKCLRKEKLDTKLGEMDAVVIKPEITLKGAFKPVGDILIWLSDDDRHYILRIESKIKIGTIVSEVISIKPGQAVP